MTKMIKMSILALSLAASAPFAMAADNGGMNNGVGGFSNNEKGPSLEEREQMIDPNSTGSIQQTCDTGNYDVNGNCVYPTPDMQ